MLRSTTAALLSSNLLTGTFTWIAQGGLVLFLSALWRVLYEHPAGLFTWHPAMNSLAIAGFVQGVLLLQPTRTAGEKKKGLQIHQMFQYTALPIILVGSFIIIYNKWLHAAAHFTSLHGKFGLATLTLILTQIIIGGVIVYAPLTKILGGPVAAKKYWKYHRMSGYVTIALLLATPLLAVESTWTLGNSTSTERSVMILGLGGVAVGVAGRISLAKLGFTSRRS